MSTTSLTLDRSRLSTVAKAVTAAIRQNKNRTGPQTIMRGLAQGWGFADENALIAFLNRTDGHVQTPAPLQIPVIELSEVYHLGSLDKADCMAIEGKGTSLAVSLCPSAWARIAKLGGQDLRILRNPSGLFLDLHAVVADKPLLNCILSWAFANMLAKPATLWKAWVFDEDFEEWHYRFCMDEEAAIDEICEYYGTDEVPHDGPNGVATEPVECVIGTAKLLALTGCPNGPADDATHSIIMAWAQTEAPKMVGRQVHGIWYQDKYDPIRLSAPWGTIFPDYVASWSAAVTSWDAAPHGRPPYLRASMLPGRQQAGS